MTSQNLHPLPFLCRLLMLINFYLRRPDIKKQQEPEGEDGGEQRVEKDVVDPVVVLVLPEVCSDEGEAVGLPHDVDNALLLLLFSDGVGAGAGEELVRRGGGCVEDLGQPRAVLRPDVIMEEAVAGKGLHALEQCFFYQNIDQRYTPYFLENTPGPCR